MGHLLTLLQKNKIIVQDGFNRADNALSMGNTNTGQTWGTSVTFGISGNKAYCPGAGTPGPQFATLDSGKSDIDVSVTITFNANEGVIARYSDGSNYILARMDSATLALFKIVASVPTNIGSFAFSPVIGKDYNVKLSVKGTTIKVYLDGADKLTATESFNQTATRCGIRLNDITGRADNFIVEAL